MRLLLLLIYLSATTAPVFAQSLDSKITIRQWSNDITMLESGVIEPLRRQFSGQRCGTGLCRPKYVRELIEKLKEIRELVTPVSYLMLRELILTIGESLGPGPNKTTCPEDDHWESIERALKTKLDYTGNVLMLLEVAGSL